MRRWIAGCALMLAATPVAAQLVVVRSTGPSAGLLPPGKILSDKANITLRDGDEITLLDDDATRIVRGPGPLIRAQSTDAVSRWSRLRTVFANRARRSALAVVRRQSPSPGLWTMRSDQYAVFCVHDPADIRIEHPAGAVALRVEGRDIALPSTTEASAARWPASLPVTEGMRISFVRNDIETGRFDIHRLGGLGNDAAALAEELRLKGCLAQMDLLRPLKEDATAAARVRGDAD